MSATTPRNITGDRLRFGFHRQIWWDWLIGTAFFFGEVGAGLFLLSVYTDFVLGALIGYLVVMAGKNGAHLMYLGRPERFWRAAWRPDRSWIARGIWATGLLGLTGLLWILDAWAVLAFPGGTTELLVEVVALASAVFLMFYDGRVMSAPGSVPYWQTFLLPVLCFTYASLGGSTLWLLFQEILGGTAENFEAMLLLENGLILSNLFLVCLYVFVMSRRSETPRQNALLWIRGTYAPVFWGVVVFVGLVVTFLLSVSHNWIHGVWISLAVAVTELTGDYALLLTLLKSGLYRPQEEPADKPPEAIDFQG